MAVQQGDSGPAQVAILMASFNGAAFLPEQLASIAAQDHDDWQLVVSDDGSGDETCTIIADFAARMPQSIELVKGPGMGSSPNFIHLMQMDLGTPFVALCDQDDRWHPDRLARGVAALRDLPPESPAIYCSATVVTDRDLNPQRLSRPVARPLGFLNALVQNVVAGNTVLMNRAAADLARKAAPAPAAVAGLAVHDWWLYQLISGAGGTVLYDPEPTLDYRQHGGNFIGANHGFAATVSRVFGLIEGRFRTWNDANIAALDGARAYLLPPHRARLDAFADLRQRGLFARLAGFWHLGAYRQTRMGQAAMWLACLLRRI